ncbi:MAG: hypothetical protein PHX73_10610 [Acidobacteriota bacterium]|nr:hypothetical protein [Acidobacteriota bacterium]
MLAAAAIVYLGVAGSAPRPDPRRRTARLQEGFLRLPVKRRLLVLFLAAFLVYNACALVLVSRGMTFSGDEPNYLLTTHSLLADRDINLENNYRNRDYFHFYDEKENPNLRMNPYARAGVKGRGYIYPINLPGISFLMVPFYAAGQAVHGFARTFLLKGSLRFGRRFSASRSISSPGSSGSGRGWPWVSGRSFPSPRPFFSTPSISTPKSRSPCFRFISTG